MATTLDNPNNRIFRRIIFEERPRMVCLEEKCVICYDEPRQAKTCYQCNANMCNSCLYAYLETANGNQQMRCPSCRTPLEMEMLMDSWQLKYTQKENLKTREEAQNLREEVRILKETFETTQHEERLKRMEIASLEDKVARMQRNINGFWSTSTHSEKSDK